MPELIYRNRRTGEERIHVEINAAEISDILDDFTPAADAFASTKELHGLLLEALAVFSPTLAETYKAADAPAVDGLREQLVAALIRSGFGEQDADDAATAVLAVGDRRIEQLADERDNALKAFNATVLKLEDARAAIARVHALRDTWRDYTMAPQTMRLVGELDTALGGSSPTATAPAEEAGAWMAFEHGHYRRDGRTITLRWDPLPPMLEPEFAYTLPAPSDVALCCVRALSEAADTLRSIAGSDRPDLRQAAEVCDSLALRYERTSAPSKPQEN